MTVVDLVEHVTSRHPQAIAIESATQRLTYDQVWRAAHAIASTLPANQPRIAIAAHRDVWGPIAHLAVLLSGASAVHLSTTAPAQRTAHALASAAVTTVLYDGPPPPVPAHVQVLDIENAAARPRATHAHGAHADAEAYVIFTSGSSGSPKGARLSHSGLTHTILAVTSQLELGVGARMSNTFDLSFDPSVLDIYSAWTSAATLVVPTRAQSFMPVTYTQQRHLTHWNSVPSLVRRAAGMNALTPDAMPSLRSTLLGGEALTWPIVRAWHTAAPTSTIRNIYGPTELTIACALSGDLSTDDRVNEFVPLGPVFSGLDWVLVDPDSGRVNDRGGELLVRGPQRLLGYVDPPSRTAFADISHNQMTATTPSNPPPSHLYYRTGDILIHNGGEMSYAGRIDRQIKVRGVRMEPADIEAALETAPGVHQAIVLLVDDDEPMLVAAYVGQPDIGSALSEHLRQRLPTAMCPTLFIHLDNMPLTGNGKADLASLRDAVISTLRHPPADASVGDDDAGALAAR